jgi:hypothetical protein
MNEGAGNEFLAPLFFYKGGNSQILRRPQDDNQFWESFANIG